MAYEYGKVKIQLRRDTAANLASVVLANGEPAYATDSGILKIGNGSDDFVSLSGITGGGGVSQEDLDTAIANLIDSAPETLDTLNEIAAAINDNASFFEAVAYSGGNISQFNNDVGYLQSEANDLTSSVTWANVPNDNITESSVTQHSGALRLTESQIVDLGNYVASGDNVSQLVNDTGYMINLTDDTTPQLGNNLDTKGYEIGAFSVNGPQLISSANGDIELFPAYLSSGNVIIKGKGHIASSGSMVLGGYTGGIGPELNRPGVGLHISATGTTYAQLKLSNEDPSTTYAASGAELALEYGLLELNNLTRWGDIRINSVNSSNQKFERAYFGSTNINLGTSSYRVPVKIYTDTATVHGDLKVTGIINMNDQYTLPTGDGTDGQVLTTDGSGNVNWESAGNPLAVVSDTSIAGGGSRITNMVSISSSDYSGITPDVSTLYFVTG